MTEGRLLLSPTISRDLRAKMLAHAHRVRRGRGGSLDQKPRLMRLAAVDMVLRHG